MEYKTTTQIEMPTLVSCNNCKSWFLVESEHSCTGIIDTTTYSHNIIWSMT